MGDFQSHCIELGGASAGKDSRETVTAIPVPYREAKQQTFALGPNDEKLIVIYYPPLAVKEVQAIHG